MMSSAESLTQHAKRKSEITYRANLRVKRQAKLQSEVCKIVNLMNSSGEKGSFKTPKKAHICLNARIIWPEPSLFAQRKFKHYRNLLMRNAGPDQTVQMPKWSQIFSFRIHNNVPSRVIRPDTLTFTTLRANSADDKLMIVFSYFSQKKAMTFHGKKSICMKCQSPLSRKSKQNVSKCRLPNFLTSKLSVKPSIEYRLVLYKY